MRLPSDIQRLGDILDEMRRTGHLDKGIKVQSLSTIWPAIRTLWGQQTVGSYVALNSRPVQFKSGVLTILCANNSIMQVLAEQKEQVIQRLNARMGAPLITDLAFGLSSVHEVSPQRAAAPIPAAPVNESLRRVVELNEAQKSQVERAASQVANPSLRAAFRRAYAAWLRWDIWRRRQAQQRQGRPASRN
ncbi:MAG: DUF721 domain-containing protein [Caldisericota bacterium]|nr:DUF721 domain-containing protein [Caldisericota bacterium]